MSGNTASYHTEKAPFDQVTTVWSGKKVPCKTGRAHSAVGGPSVSSSVTSMKKLVALSAGNKRLLLMSKLGKLTRMVSADKKAV